jgi:hypothetical protein
VLLLLLLLSSSSSLLLRFVFFRVFELRGFVFIGGFLRDMYGFAVRPQHLKRYREHARIYKVCVRMYVIGFCSLWISLCEWIGYA